ncbi:hypothetical protein FHR48_001256 [Xanthomonas arboricola]|nr:hypothetical protein [Xanthomonas cannabis]
MAVTQNASPKQALPQIVFNTCVHQPLSMT